MIELREATNKAVMVETIKHYGVNHQLTVAIEEMAELIQIFTKYKRGIPIDIRHLVEEYADVIYMMDQVKYMFDISDEEIDKIILEKQERQVRRILSDGK